MVGREQSLVGAGLPGRYRQRWHISLCWHAREDAAGCLGGWVNKEGSLDSVGRMCMPVCKPRRDMSCHMACTVDMCEILLMRGEAIFAGLYFQARDGSEVWL
jgi:hypothetical protein